MFYVSESKALWDRKSTKFLLSKYQELIPIYLFAQVEIPFILKIYIGYYNKNKTYFSEFKFVILIQL